MADEKALQLEGLFHELDKIQRQQSALKHAISNDKAIIIHPRREVG
jgi:hypothetical protein